MPHDSLKCSYERQHWRAMQIQFQQYYINFKTTPVKTRGFGMEISTWRQAYWTVAFRCICKLSRLASTYIVGLSSTCPLVGFPLDTGPQPGLSQACVHHLGLQHGTGEKSWVWSVAHHAGRPIGYTTTGGGWEEGERERALHRSTRLDA